MSNDLIRRQDAIERVTKEHDFYKGATIPTDKARRDELLNVMCWLGELPSAQPQQTCEYWDSESNFCTLHRPSAQPTIDAVEVVRCFECKYFREHEQEFKDRWGSDWDGYCSYWNSHSTVFSNFCGFAQKADGEVKSDALDR